MGESGVPVMAVPDDGWREAPMMGEVVAPALAGAAAANGGLPQVMVKAPAAVEALRVAAARSCERRSFVPAVLLGRWQEALREAGEDELAQALRDEHEAEALAFLELLAALLKELWGRLARRRMLAEMAERAQAARQREQQRRPRLEEVEEEARRVLGIHYRPPTTPEAREKIIDFVLAWRKATTKRQQQALLKKMKG